MKARVNRRAIRVNRRVIRWIYAGLALAAGTALIAAALAARAPRLLAAQASAAAIDFEKEILPIFRNSCFSCHGPRSQMGQLRLDSRTTFFKGGISGPVVKPGESGGSLLVDRITGKSGLPVMPMVGEKLSAGQVAAIRAWIDQGAKWPEGAGAVAAAVRKHWAYVKPERPPVPAVRNRAWTRNAIDRFVLARLDKEGLAPSPAASRTTLIRRLSLDLTGLPPTLEEVDRFLADRTPGAYERLVDRMLASPHYGERWAMFWLDLARYADTNGYESDEPRTNWAWRDWVVQAFNINLPFDVFTIEQLAGDLLDKPTQEQLIATGFHRNTLVNSEAGAKDDEYRDAAVKDRVDTTATVWMGSTLGCAQCHNHKYDPFTQKDYYAFYAFFNNTAESGIELTQDLRVFLGDRKELERRQAALAPLKKLMEAATPEIQAAQGAWQADLQRRLPAMERSWQVLEPATGGSASGLRSLGGAKLEKLADGSILASGMNPDRDTYEVDFRTSLSGVTGLKLEVMPHDSLPQKGSGRGPNGAWLLAGFEAEAWDDEQLKQGQWLLANKPEWSPWYEVAAFQALSVEEAHESSYPPERGVDLTASYENGKLKWRERTDWKEGTYHQLEGYNAATYLYRRISARQAMPVWISLGSDHGVKVWLNGQKLSETGALEALAPKNGLLRLDLRAGQNDLLLKFTNGAGYYRFFFKRHEGRSAEQLVRFGAARAEPMERGQNVMNLLDESAPAGWEGKAGQPHEAIFAASSPVGSEGGLTLRVRLRHESQRKGHNIGRFRISVTTLAREQLAELMSLPGAVREALLAPAGQATEDQRRAIATHYRSIAPMLAGTRAKHDALARDLEKFVETHSARTLVMKELEQPRETFVQARGNFLSRGERVTPAAPAILPPLAGGQKADRLALARWLMSPEHPLTARVIVNHFWRAVFGQGIVRTGDDFGSQGEPPTHAELLDWLAVEFRESGWDVKRLLKLMVTSATYQQSSGVDGERLRRDPENRLLARAPRYRLPAEGVRDAALKAAGLLSSKMGGPAVFPPLPASVFDNLFIEEGFQAWPKSTGEDRYRRGLYTFWKRTAVYPSFATFDAPERAVCTVQRPRSNTPLQALATLNDETFLEAAGGLARRMVRETPQAARPRARAAYGFRLVTARRPSERELQSLVELYTRAAGSYRADPASARRLAAAGLAGAKTEVPPTELAPWIVVANVLLNLDEAVTRE